MRRILPWLLLLAAAGRADEAKAAPDPVNGLCWEVWMPPVFASLGAVEFRASLRNAQADPLGFSAKGKRPPVVLVLTRDGDKPVRMPLPAKAQIDRGAARLARRQPAWTVAADLRAAFGALAPGKYTLRVVHAAAGYTVDLPGFEAREIVSRPARFEVVATTLEAARKNSPRTPGLDFTVEKMKSGGRIGVLVNRTEAPVSLWAYGDVAGRPLGTLALAEHWTGGGWDRTAGGFCGTGLERVTLAPGARREIQLPPHRAGIVRFALSVFAGEKERPLASEPVLIDA